MEKQIQNKIIKYLNANGYYYAKIIVASRSGVPDIIACVQGRFVAIEVKSGGNKLTKLQQFNRDLIEQSGGIYITAYSLSDVIEALNKEFFNNLS